MPETRPSPEVVARLNAAFAAEEATLRAALDRARADFNHRGLRGSTVERAVRDFLSRHLPRRYAVGTGEVIDRFGTRSNQLDLIVLNEEQPFVHEPDTEGTYLVEGVSAVGEIKTVLDGNALDDILDKGRRLLSFKPTVTTGATVHSNPSDLHRFVASLPYFAIALESRLAPGTVLSRLSAQPNVPCSSGVAVPPLDALFVLDQGVYFNFGDGQGAQQLVDDDGVSARGWVGPAPDGTLVNLFTWLLAVMPRVTQTGSIATPYLIATNLEQRTSPSEEEPSGAAD